MEQISHIKRGKVLFPTDFRGIGTDSAIKMSLSRIAKQGHLTRLSHGIYLKPGRLSKKQEAVPAPEFIADAIAERENIRIRPAGNYALYHLGFESDKPAVLTYVTDGEPRKISINDHTIVFKSTTPKKLSMKGPISSLIIQALEEVGKDKITTELEVKIKKALQNEDAKKIMDDIKKAPAWIYNLMLKLK
ncbi:DUF6088 family protein [Mucilaginibacter sp. AW1-7]|uniref:DUF6088 family protein n=1 Tax=Mucilaginibacter sp. AW1-7 TaxID=3349874 RepID=UPI003F739CBA